MKISKIFKIIGGIVAVAGVIAAIYLAIQKLTDKKEPEYFNDDDFFECDNDLEIIEVEKDAAKEEEAPAEEPKKEAAPKKKKAAKKASKSLNAEKAVRCAAFFICKITAPQRGGKGRQQYERQLFLRPCFGGRRQPRNLHKRSA